MKIEKLLIDNFKSLNNFTLENPNPFSVFVGANGVGKSNIFEALEYMRYKLLFQAPLKQSFESGESIESFEIDSLFGGYQNFINFLRFKDDVNFSITYEHGKVSDFTIPSYEKSEIIGREIGIASGVFKIGESFKKDDIPFYIQFVKNFSKIFIKASDKKKLNTSSKNRLNLDCSNLEKVLKRLLLDDAIREDIKDWLSLFIPAFKNIEIKSDELSGTDTILFYEKDTERPFTKNLISDGTFNILCLLVAVYQSDSPQFICIEEPEIGLNPYVVKELVTFFREQCKEKGHYIWINTHSETLVRELLPEEIIVINKEDGNTQAKQFIGKNMHGLSMETAWLTNFLGGGIPW